MGSNLSRNVDPRIEETPKSAWYHNNETRENKCTTKISLINVEPASSEVTEPLIDELYTEVPDTYQMGVRPILIIMKCVGFLPIRTQKSGWTTFKICSPQMLYSAVAIVVLCGTTHYFNGFGSGMKTLDSKKFNEFIMHISFIALKYQQICIYLMDLLGTGEMAKFMNSWRSFQLKFYRQTGEAMDLRLTKYSILAVMIVAANTLSVFVSNELSILQQQGSLIYYQFFQLLSDMFAALWYINCLAIRRGAEELQKHFLQKIARNSSTKSIIEYKHLWVSLSKLTNQLGNSHSFLYIHYFLLVFFRLTLGSYGLVSSLLFEHITKNDLSTTWLVHLFTYSGVSLLIFCCSAHETSDIVETAFRDVIMSLDDPSMDTRERDELDRFLSAIKMYPPIISLCNLVTINRDFLSNVLLTMSSYLVLIIQFRYGLTDSSGILNVEQEQFNSTAL